MRAIQVRAKMESPTARELFDGSTGQHTQVTFLMANRTAKANLNSKMVQFTKVVLKRIYSMSKVDM